MQLLSAATSGCVPADKKHKLQSYVMKLRILLWDTRAKKTLLAFLLATAVLTWFYWPWRPTEEQCEFRSYARLKKAREQICEATRSPQRTTSSTVHFVTAFARTPETYPDLIRTAQTLDAVQRQRGVDLHWVLIEVSRHRNNSGDRERHSRCLPALAAALDSRGIDYSHFALEAEDETGESLSCLTEPDVYPFARRWAALHLARSEHQGMVHFGRLESAYPLPFFESVRDGTLRVSSFPAVLLSNTTHIYSPLVDDDDETRVIGLAGNRSDPFFQLAFAYNLEYLRSFLPLLKAGDWARMERPPLEDVVPLTDADKTLVYHVRTKHPYRVKNVRSPPEYAGDKYNLDRLLHNMWLQGAIEKSDENGTPLKTCPVDKCEYTG